MWLAIVGFCLFGDFKLSLGMNQVVFIHTEGIYLSASTKNSDTPTKLFIVFGGLLTKAFYEVCFTCRTSHSFINYCDAVNK